ncbi:hypothetical protein M011DRAFT_460883 [Sporormia fimetaria CBS 119925]|uniref:[histone H3]-trimethyl-L-lysine(9) demethylase n=1 Tax=Sporormia fimetaria CBS 119925 TaxID=1340428 RepID=A0A6A6V1I4_9PLEO|nr:hypothetical protein M011DRAFT_460883 [Sporormia fimetaria CBS 119925]
MDTEAAPAVVPSVETPPAKEEHNDAAPALTPPTSEDLEKRAERMSSELSELDSSDDEEEIEPDHYFEGGKVPVFKPTMDQFRDFKKFINKIDKHGMKSGIVKVIPPKEWRESLPDLTEAVKTIKVKNPIMQEFAGQHGIYMQSNIEKQRSYNLPEWRALTDEAHHQPPASRGERRRGAVDAPARMRPTRGQAAAQDDDASPGPRRGRGRPRRGAPLPETKEEDEDELEVPPTPRSPGDEDEAPKPKRARTKVKKEEQEDGTPTKARGRQPKSTTSRRLNNRTATADYVNEEAFRGFDYHLPNVGEYTIERCKELEENYWKTINYGQPMYGADMPGSLFDDRTTSWNVAKLPNILDVLGTKVPGVNTAYLYLGMWKATFAWHLEDVDLYSINYIHFGAPKQWYSISQEDARRFEHAMKSIWPRDAKNCSQFLRHKTYLISPAQLEKKFNIKVNRLVHYEGEFVITYPYGYHSGYNLGYNCAESVNFANEAWLNYGRIAKKCECAADTVWVDVDEIERKMRGEPTPEYYEETDDEDEEDAAEHLPSPPPSVAGKNKKRAPAKPSNKRKRVVEEPAERPKPRKVRRIILRKSGKGMPCVLCPHDVDYDELLPTDNGLKAHRLCADYTPETYISPKPNEVVCNVANISKERLDLKCNYCGFRRGAVFQCTQKKCTRAFHATCAVPAGVQVDLGPMPTFDEEGTEYFYDGYDFRCRFHRPKKRHNKKVTVDTLESDRFVMRYAKTLKPKDVVQFQFIESELYRIYGGLVIENRPAEQSVLVEVLPDGDRVEVDWKYLLVLDPAESERPKPSANAKPLPEHLNQTDSSLAITNRTDGVPEKGDPFLDPNAPEKWEEFNTAPEVTQKVDKVNMSAPDKLWYYLGKTSTEARPQYTEDLARPRHNPKSNFLDTVKPPPPPAMMQPYRMQYNMKPVLPHIYTQPPGPAYKYKPKQDATYKTPAYAPDNRKNPSSPVAHQPNVVYDHRGSGTHYPPPSQTAHQRPATNFHHYTPPQANGYSAPAGSATFVQERYTPGSQTLPPYPYGPPGGAPTANRQPQQQPAYAYQQPQPQGQGQRHVYSPHVSHPAPYTQAPAPAPAPSAAPLSNILSNPAGKPNSSMYAHAYPFPTRPHSQADYLAYITKYPYLKNAFLRRAKTYISPYSPNGGITPEWRDRMPGNVGPPRYSQPIAPRPPSTTNQHPPHPQGNPAPYQGLPPLPPFNHRPTPQFQSADAFQRDMARSTPQPTPTKWDSMMRQLQSSASPAPSPAVASMVPPNPNPALGVSGPVDPKLSAPAAHGPPRAQVGGAATSLMSPLRPEVEPITPPANATSSVEAPPPKVAA